VDDLRLVIKGKEYVGWESVSFRRSMETLCGEFTVTTSDIWTPSGEPWKISEQDPVELYVDQEKILTGYIDSVQTEIADSKTLTIEGRDKTADLVDCANLLKNTDLQKMSIQQIFDKFLEGYGIKAVFDFMPDPAKVKFSEEQVITPGDSVFQAMNIFAAEDGFILNTTPDGDLFITREGKEKADVALKLGDNIKKISGRYDMTNRFFKYIVKGSPQDTTGGGWKAGAIKGVDGLAVDAGMKRQRVLLIHSGKKMNAKQCMELAEWTRNTHRAHSLAVDVTLQGWKQKPGGKLWKINQFVNVEAAGVGLENDNMNLLIGAVEFTKNESGTQTNLSLVPSGSYTLKPPKIKTAGKVMPRWTGHK
jgi:prophage tail gpP-like protein